MPSNRDMAVDVMADVVMGREDVEDVPLQLSRSRIDTVGLKLDGNRRGHLAPAPTTTLALRPGYVALDCDVGGDGMATEGFEQAVNVAKGVLANVKVVELDDPTPCASWKVRDVINHLVGGSYFFAAATNGEAFGGGAEAIEFRVG